MKKFLLFFLTILVISPIYAALDDGDDAPDFTVTDINGNTFSLFTRMGPNKSACLDFFATWCGPCWSFHTSGVLEQVYDNLSAETVVLALEADFDTNTNCLYGPSGCNDFTQGNWVAGVGYQITDLSTTNGPSVAAEYNITYFPTLYVISPDKRVWEIISRTYQNYRNWIQNSFKLAATGNITHSVCGDNGRIILTPTGGLGALSYQWNNGATTKDLLNINGGTYKVTITDQNGYYKEFGPYIVNGPHKRVAITSQSIEHIKCNSLSTGEIEIGVEFGTPGYTYLWSSGQRTPVITNIRAGSYTVTVTDANACTVKKTYTVLEPTDVTLSARTTTDQCDASNGTILADAIGGVQPYSFDIGDGPQASVFFDNLHGGLYTITVTDYNNCEETYAVEVPITHAPKAEAGQNKTIDCINDTLVLDGGGSSYGQNFTYLWTTRDGRIIKNHDMITSEIDLPGRYVLRIEDITNRCVALDSVTVSDNRNFPDIEATGDTTLTCLLNQQKLKGRTNSLPIKYFWTKIAETFNDTAKEITVQTIGKYIFNVKDTINQCIARDTVTILEHKELPIIIVGQPNELNCKDRQVILDATGSDTGADIIINWETNNGNIVNGKNTLYPTVNKSAIYRLILNNSKNGCESTKDVHVIENIELPTASAGNEKELSCILKTVELDGTNSSQGSQFTYLWSSKDGNIVSGANSLKPIVDKSGKYSLEVSNLLNFCKSANEMQVLEQLTPVSAFDQQVQNLVVNLQDQSIGIPKQWQWSFGDGEISTERNPVHTYAKIGEYEICLQIINDCGVNKKCKNILLTTSGGILVISNWEIHNVACFGGGDGYIKVNIEGGVAPYAYSWSNGGLTKDLHQLAHGSYELVITDDIGTWIRKTFAINQPTEIQSSNVNVRNSEPGSSNGFIEWTTEGGVPPYTYAWSNGAKTEDINQLPAGDYTCVVTDQNSCQKTFGPFEIKEVVANNEVGAIASFILVPNPVVGEGKIIVKMNGVLPFSVVMQNTMGQTVFESQGNNNSAIIHVNTSKFSNGVYSVTLKSNHQILTKKWIIH